MSHLPEEASRAISEVQENDQLFLMLDVQNDFDKNAIAIRTGAPSTLVGYCPKYYCAFVNDAIRRGAGVAVNAKRVNPVAPKSMKLLCTMHVKLKAEAAKNCFGHPDLLPYADNGYGLAP